MKKLLLFVLVVLTFIGCSPRAEQKAAKEKAKQDSILWVLKAMAEEDSINAAKVKLEGEKNADLIPSSIQIQKYYTSEPNSAGGVDVYLNFKNISDKTVKYASFTLVPYNAVGDMVKSEIGGDTYKKIQLTGPIKPGATGGYGHYWSTLWYNSTITHMKITGIELEYMDGTTISTNNESIISQVLPKKK